MSSPISLAGLDKAAVLAALYNASKPLGMGFMHYDPTPMTVEKARDILDQTPGAYFDYLAGRVMKVDLSSDELDPWGFDRDNGDGAAARAIDELRSTNSVNPAGIQASHHIGTLEEAENVQNHLDEEPTITERDGHATIRLGLGDMAEHLGPKVDEAIKKRRA